MRGWEAGAGIEAESSAGGKGGPGTQSCHAVQCSAEAAWLSDRAGARLRPRRGTPLLLPLLHLDWTGRWLAAAATAAAAVNECA